MWVLGMLITAFLILLALSAGFLPPHVASHFNFYGDADGWMARETMLLLMGAVGAGLPLFIVASVFLTQFLPNSVINLPNRDYWLSPERRASTHRWLLSSAQWMACLIVLLMMALHVLVVCANRQPRPHLFSPAAYALLGFFVLAEFTWLVVLVRHFLGPKPPTLPSRGYGLVTMLLVAVLVPSACLVWFMSRAVQNERLAVRQKLLEAYRGNVALVQERLENHLRQSSADLELGLEQTPAPLLFAKQVESGAADAVIVLTPQGTPVYPAATGVAQTETQAETAAAEAEMSSQWLEASQLEFQSPATASARYARIAAATTNTTLMARAWQAEARCFVRLGKNQEALQIVTESLTQPRVAKATDSQGRLIAPSAALMALEILSAEPQTNAALSALKAKTLNHLNSQLNDYREPALGSTQRRFLMHEVERLSGTNVSFPTLAAEDLAARYLDARDALPMSPGLRRSPLPDTWQYVSPHGKVVLLHETDALLKRLQAALPVQSLPSDLKLALLPPGQEPEKSFLLSDAGSALPGWRLSLALKDQRLFDSAAEQRISSYLWIGAVVLTTVVVLAFLLLRTIRRQMTLTQLRTDLVANVTHELKTPLSSMRLLVETLLNAPELNTQTTREYLQLIAAENLRLSRLIENFLTFSRIERNKLTFNYRAQKPADIIRAAAAAAGERFETESCRFQIRADDNLPRIHADSDAVVTALVNLLDNAWKYSDAPREITLSAGATNGSVSFAVADNGIGLPRRETKKIFKRFYQVDQRETRASQGCGLGLSIVKFIVTAHRGKIQVESRPGQGSTFTLLFPACPPADSLN
jgi:signal transduction histidine kinase